MTKSPLYIGDPVTIKVGIFKGQIGLVADVDVGPTHWELSTQVVVILKSGNVMVLKYSRVELKKRTHPYD